jgi:bla regulator protein blaR1
MSIIDFLPVPFVYAMVWSIIHSMWQILAIALLWRFSIWLARKAPAMARQNLSIFAFSLIPVVFLITFFKQYSIYSSVQRVAYAEFDATSVQSLENLATWYLVEKGQSPVSNFLDANTSLIFWLYWIGIALFSAWSIITYTRLWHVSRRNLSPVPQSWADALESTIRKVRLPGEVKVFLSEQVSVPAVIGFFKPVVLLPVAIAASLTMREVEDILLHELYHIRCKDHYVNAMQHVFEILFFYHPCTWWLSRTLRVQREEKVDEWVVGQTHNPLEYAQTLLNLEENRNAKLKTALAATSSRNTLLTRIKNIMHMKTRNFKTGQKIAAMLVIVLALFSLAWANPNAFVYFGAGVDYNAAGSQLMNDHTNSPDLSAYVAESSDPKPVDQFVADPERIVLENGESVSWSELSEADREEIRQAIAEAQLAIKSAMAEINMDEIMLELKQAREEIRMAMSEVNHEFNNEEFKHEMKQAMEQVRKAMEEVNQELTSDEFKAEMRKLHEEVRLALQDVDQSFNDEQFKAEMQEMSKELQKALGQLDSVDWAGLGLELGTVMQEVGKSLEMLGPTLNEVLKNIEFEINKEAAKPKNQQEN